MLGSYIHVLLPGKERLARRVQQQDALDQVQRAQDQQVVLPLAPLGHEAIQGPDEPHGRVPFETLLQLEELAKREVVGELGEAFSRRAGRRVGLLLLLRQTAPPPLMLLLFLLLLLLRRRCCSAIRQANLRQQALHLAQSLADLGPVVR